MIVVIVISIVVILLLVFLMWYINRPAPKEEETPEEEPEPEPEEVPIQLPEEVITPAPTPVVVKPPTFIPPTFTPPVPTQAHKTQAIALSNNKGTLKLMTSLVSGVPYMRDSADGTIVYLGEYTNAWDVMYAMVAAGCNGYTWFAAAQNNWGNLAYGIKKDPADIIETPNATAVSWVYGGNAV